MRSHLYSGLRQNCPFDKIHIKHLPIWNKMPRKSTHGNNLWLVNCSVTYYSLTPINALSYLHITSIELGNKIKFHTLIKKNSKKEASVKTTQL